MHPLLVFLAMFGGLATFGIPGVFFGPLLVATATAALTMYERMPRGEQPKAG